MQPPHGPPPGGHRPAHGYPAPQHPAANGHAAHGYPQQGWHQHPHPGWPQHVHPQHVHPQHGYSQQGQPLAVNQAPATSGGFGAPPQQQGMALAVAQPTAVASGRTVFGLPLEQGERILYYKRNATLIPRIFLGLFGIPMIMLFGLGLYMIYLAIVHRSDKNIYAQAITSKRLLAINGVGKPVFQIRWEDVRGMNKVLRNGWPTNFGVRDAAGTRFMYADDLAMVERTIEHYLGNPKERNAAGPDVFFDPMPT